MVAVLVLAAGCGGGSSADGGGSTPPPTTTSTSPSAPPAGTSAQQIRQAWISFFKGSTPAAAKIPLLQRGSSVAAVINAQAGNSLATGTAANVSAITVTSSRRATVHYTITIDGKPALAHQSGLAVKVGGHWLVSLDSFCALLALEGTHPAACPNPGPTAGP
jgi:hypothetical protein